MPGGGISRLVPWPPESKGRRPPNKLSHPPRREAKIEHEVGPSTVKPWLTFWQHLNTQQNDHLRRAIADQRMRTPYATGILARTGCMPDPTRPRRELQFFPSNRSMRTRLQSCRGPPDTEDRTVRKELQSALDGELRRELLERSTYHMTPRMPDPMQKPCSTPSDTMR
jgi:hypothetical protein